MKVTGMHKIPILKELLL